MQESTKIEISLSWQFSKAYLHLYFECNLGIFKWVPKPIHTYLGPFPSCLELFCIWPHILADLAQGRIDPDCPTLFLKCLCQQLALRHYFCHHLQRLIVFHQYHLQLKREKKIIDWNRFFPGKPISKAFWNPNWFIPRKGI